MTHTITASSTYIDPQRTADEISPENFELFIRAYIRRHMAKLQPKDASIMLICTPDYGKTELKHANWSVGPYNDTQTKGEILSQVIDEQNRRRGFTESCTLRLIEAPTIDATAEATPQAKATSEE